jgi:integrase
MEGEIEEAEEEGVGEKMGIFKRNKIYWYKFQWMGVPVVESTKQYNDKVARQMESAHRTSLAKGEVGIREKKVILSEFLKKDFLPYAEATHAAKPRTYEYYRDGANMVLKCDWAGEKIDQISDQHARQLASKFSALSASRINCGLRTLRRALRLAFEWGKLDRQAKITLAKGERQRDRVLTDEELPAYLNACPQPWKDCATIIAEEGTRPGEVFALQWPHLILNGSGGLIRIAEGKSKAARRVLPMTPNVHALLQARHEAAGRPTEGWVFPSGSSEGHFNGDTAKDQHAKALKDSGVKRFEPYILRHTALTTIAKGTPDPYAIATIAGHSGLAMTKRYVHPQADAIERAFTAAFGQVLDAATAASEGIGVGTKLGTTPKTGKSKPRKLLVRKGGLEPPRFYPPDPKSGASANSATFAPCKSIAWFIATGSRQL